MKSCEAHSIILQVFYSALYQVPNLLYYIKIPSHPYVLLNRTILCNCIVEAENNFLLESTAACDPDGDDADLEMYFVANTAFLNYFEGLINMLEAPFLHNVTTQEHILPISLESDDFDKELLAAPETLRELV